MCNGYWFSWILSRQAESRMASAYSFFSTHNISSSHCRFLRPPNPTLSVSKTFLHRNHHHTTCIISSLPPTTHSPSPIQLTVNKYLDSVFVFLASVALSVSIFAIDIDSASAFVVTPSRKLQTDELATVRLFQENTPSVVYITNLAAR